MVASHSAGSLFPCSLPFTQEVINPSILDTIVAFVAVVFTFRFELSLAVTADNCHLSAKELSATFSSSKERYTREFNQASSRQLRNICLPINK